MNKYIILTIFNDTIGFSTNLNYVESEIDDIVEFYFDLEGVKEEKEKEYMKENIEVEDDGCRLYFDDEVDYMEIKKIKS